MRTCPNPDFPSHVAQVRPRRLLNVAQGLPQDDQRSSYVVFALLEGHQKCKLRQFRRQEGHLDVMLNVVLEEGVVMKNNIEHLRYDPLDLSRQHFLFVRRGLL